MKTKNISPKISWPVILQIIALVSSVIATRDFDAVQQSQLFTLVATAVIGYIAPPGIVEHDFLEGGVIPEQLEHERAENPVDEELV